MREAIRARQSRPVVPRWACAAWVILWVGCEAAEVVPPDHPEPDLEHGPEGPTMIGQPVPDPGDVFDPLPAQPRRGFIGGPCSAVDDCSYDGATCLRAAPEGLCTKACERLCPDRDGFPVTFCIEGGELDGPSPGACVSRCDFNHFPERGCRDGFGCVPRIRVSDPSVTQLVCVPGVETPTGSCTERLAALGVDFDVVTRADSHPNNHPELTCHIEEPVVLHPPIHGVDFAYYDGSPTPNITAACNMALALVDTVDDVAARGVVKVLHYGTYNCRVIAGTSRLSRHAFGDAIDLYGFVFGDGRRYTVVGDFEDGDATPESPGGEFLYQAVHRWHDAELWSIILTPNYNAAHDDHFHVDLTPGADFLGAWSIGPGYLGPAPVND